MDSIISSMSCAFHNHVASSFFFVCSVVAIYLVSKPKTRQQPQETVSLQRQFSKLDTISTAHKSGNSVSKIPENINSTYTKQVIREHQQQQCQKTETETNSSSTSFFSNLFILFHLFTVASAVPSKKKETSICTKLQKTHKFFRNFQKTTCYKNCYKKYSAQKNYIKQEALHRHTTITYTQFTFSLAT